MFWTESLYLNTLVSPHTKAYYEMGDNLNSVFFIMNTGVFAGFTNDKFESVNTKLSLSFDNLD